jgi:hypothetical protein
MAQVTFSKGYALLIGVGADLPVTVKDATALRDVLIDKNRSAYPPEQVELLIEASATRQNILSTFNRLIEQINQDPDATVIIYFSGHGGRVEYLDGVTEYFLVPYGFDWNRRAETAISGLEFTEKIEAIKARKLVVLLDCCHAGGIPDLKESGVTFIKSPVPSNLLDVLDTGKGRVVIASSYEEEVSYTGTPYSVFTTCLLEALAGSASVNKDGYARILDVLIYLFKFVPQKTADRQHPFVKKVLDLGDNFPLCYYAGGKNPLPEEELKPTVSSFSIGRKNRLEQRLKALQQEWNLRNEKITRIRKSSASQADVAIKFQLEQQLLEEEANLALVSKELDELEQALQ